MLITHVIYRVDDGNVLIVRVCWSLQDARVVVSLLNTEFRDYEYKIQPCVADEFPKPAETKEN